MVKTTTISYNTIKKNKTLSQFVPPEEKKEAQKVKE
jgi:hypothetical protein